MSIAIDFGNTRIKVGIFNEDDGLEKFSVFNYSDDEFSAFISQFSHKEECIYSHVRTEKTLLNLIEQHFTSPIELTYRLNLPFTMGYKTPETLGKDRIAACAGAMEIFDNRPLLVIDAGTCITYDFISEHDHYMGGAISPGIELKLRALHEFTDKLPNLPFNPDNKPVNIGKSTNESLLSGAVTGTLHEISGFIATFGSLQTLTIVLTGGHAQYLADNLENSTFAAPNLVLIGLNKIRKLNA